MILEFQIESIKNYFKIDLVNFFNKVVDFISNDKVHIFNFYLGQETLNLKAFQNLENLLIEVDSLISLISSNKNFFVGAHYFELFDKLEDSKSKLKTIENAFIYLRTSKDKALYADRLQSFALKQNQTIENLAMNEIKTSNFQDDWGAIAVKNNLEEEDYTVDGGVMLKATLSPDRKGVLNIRDVVGDLEGDNIYGKDLSKDFLFEDDDLLVLTSKETVIQAVNILASLRQGQNPQYPQNGIKIGFLGPVSSIAYPIVFKQIIDTFSQDDTLGSLKVMDISYASGGLFISFEIETKRKELIDAQIIL